MVSTKFLAITIHVGRVKQTTVISSGFYLCPVITLFICYNNYITDTFDKITTAFKAVFYLVNQTNILQTVDIFVTTGTICVTYVQVVVVTH